MTVPQTIGSRAQVMHGNAKKTSGGLTKSQLKYNKQGNIVSKKASALAKKNNRLVKAGYVTRKGQFGVNMKGGGGYKIISNPQNELKTKKIISYCIPGLFNTWKPNNNAVSINNKTGQIIFNNINNINYNYLYKKNGYTNQYRLYLNARKVVFKFKTNK